jgi:hypothetical protein
MAPNGWDVTSRLTKQNLEKIGVPPSIKETEEIVSLAAIKL